MFSWISVVGTGNLAVIEMHATRTDQDCFDKKNRKKCAAKTTSPERSMSKLVLDPFIDVFHNNFLMINRFKQ